MDKINVINLFLFHLVRVSSNCRRLLAFERYTLRACFISARLRSMHIQDATSRGRVKYKGTFHARCLTWLRTVWLKAELWLKVKEELHLHRRTLHSPIRTRPSLKSATSHGSGAVSMSAAPLLAAPDLSEHGQVRISAPTLFKGTNDPEEFQDFKFRLKMYLGVTRPNLVRIMTEIENNLDRLVA